MTRKTKRTVGLIAVFLAAVLCCGFIGWMTGGFQNFDRDYVSDKFSPKLNEDNLFKAENVTLTSKNDGYGLKFTVNDDGSIHVKGTASREYNELIGTVILDSGKYTITALNGASMNTAYVTAVVGSVETPADFTNNQLNITTDNTSVELVLHVLQGTEIDATIYPVIVSGEEAGSFYA